MKTFMPAIKMALFVFNGLLIIVALLNIIHPNTSYNEPELTAIKLRLFWLGLLIVFCGMLWLQIKWLRKKKD